MTLSSFQVLDIETTILSYMKRKASPFHPNNWVVAAAAVDGNDKITESYWGHDKGGHRGWLASLLKTNPKFLVGFNFKFDLLWLLQHEEDYTAYQDWIAAGGQIWDCQLAEYLLDGMVQESHMLSLDEVSLRYGGELKNDEVKAFWEQGISTEEIPKDLLMDYLSGRWDEEDNLTSPGDIQNTKQVFLGQLKQAAKSKQMASIQLNNGALVATIEMERNGLFVDKATMMEHAKEMEQEIEVLKGTLNGFLPADLPFTFNWGSRKQLSAFIFGGRVKYDARVWIKKDGTTTLDPSDLAYAQKDEVHYVLSDGRTYEVREYDVNVVTAPEYDQRVMYASGKNKGTFKTKKVKVDDHTRPKSRMEEFPYDFKGLTTGRKEWETSEVGVYSTSSEVIEELGQTTDIPFLLAFANLQAKVKDLGTYYYRQELYADGRLKAEKGMLTLVQDDGIVHHTINMVSTVTARFSHTNPNAGNLPRGDDNSAKGLHSSRVKEGFVSRFGQQGRMGSSDFTALEVYCQANLSKDTQLVKDLLAGLDMHCARLAAVRNKDYHEVLRLCKGDKNAGIAADPAWSTARTHIKTYSFQRAYGAGATKIAAFLKVPKEEVEKWIVADDARYPGIPLFNAKVEEFVKSHLTPLDKWANHPLTKQQVRLHRGYVKTFDGKKYCFNEQLAPDYIAKRGTLTSFSPTEMKNYPVQGLGGEWMKAAMWNAVRYFYSKRNWGGRALLINTVHDALYWDSHEDVTRESGAAIHAAMNGASDLMEYWFDHKIEVPVPCETTSGPSMADESHFPDNQGFEREAAVVRQYIRAKWMNNYQPSFL